LIKGQLKRVVVDLQAELEAWLRKADKDDAIRVICGGPGCGKSSFAKIFAATCAARWETSIPNNFVFPSFSTDIKRSP
jgi:replication-associated recombination protein RarA